MVGAIQAATDLVVVTTPEAGSFEGTYDLVSYAMSLAKTKRPITTTLIVNNVAPWQSRAAEHLTMFYEGKHIESVPDNNRIKPDKVVSIRSDENIKKFVGSYELGAASKTPLWESVCKIGHYILNPENKTENDA
jgi:MinD-like ATPase involved in chromosome partitioning or flagellar assembly